MPIPARSIETRCPLCGSEGPAHFASDTKRSYLRCPACALAYVPSEFFLSQEAEKERYERHNNTAADADYAAYIRGFAADLRRIPLADPAVLDFGSGPSRMLEQILGEAGIECISYDPLYGIGLDVFDRTYDVVALCEVIEHLRDMRAELGRVRSVLAAGGFVALRTEIYGHATDFAQWWYAQDPTHVNFFCEQTIERAAEHLGLEIYDSNGKNVFLLGPPAGR